MADLGHLGTTWPARVDFWVQPGQPGPPGSIPGIGPENPKKWPSQCPHGRIRPQGDKLPQKTEQKNRSRGRIPGLEAEFLPQQGRSRGPPGWSQVTQLDPRSDPCGPGNRSPAAGLTPVGGSRRPGPPGCRMWPSWGSDLVPSGWQNRVQLGCWNRPWRRCQIWSRGWVTSGPADGSDLGPVGDDLDDLDDRMGDIWVTSATAEVTSATSVT